MKDQPIQNEEMINNPETKNELLFTDPAEGNVNINSGKKEQTQTNVTIESEIINNTLRFMVLRGKAWPTTHQAFIHLSMLFMSPTWYSENDLATKMNDNFKEAPFTVNETKKALKNLANLSILETKQDKGKTKYKLSNLGNALIVKDNILMDFLGFNKEPEQQPEQQSSGAAAAEAEVAAGAVIPEPILEDEPPKSEEGNNEDENKLTTQLSSTN